MSAAQPERKPCVLLFTDWFWPGFKAGGPIQSCINLTRNLGDKIEFRVITADRDLGDAHAYPSVKTGEWVNAWEGVKVWYCPEGFSFRQMKCLILETHFDRMSLNSMFSMRFSYWPLIVAITSDSRKYPVLFSPRGMLAKGALSIKPLKKKIFLNMFRMAGIQHRLVWHATGEHEKGDILRIFPGVDVRLAPNLPAASSFIEHSNVKIRGDLKLIFVGRISVVKNIRFLIRCLSKLNNTGIRLDLYGPMEDAQYWEQCRQDMASLPDGIIVEWKGELKPAEVQQKLSGYHFFVSATRGENFGHAIFESLDQALPVLITDTTPWRNLSERLAGWDLPAENEQAWIQTFNHMLRMDNNEWQGYRDGAFRFAQTFRTQSRMLEENLLLFGGTDKRA